MSGGGREEVGRRDFFPAASFNQEPIEEDRGQCGCYLSQEPTIKNVIMGL